VPSSPARLPPASGCAECRFCRRPCIFAWSRTGPTERRRILLAAADKLEAKIGDICAAMAAEVGASALWGGFNVMASANLIREAASLTTQIQGETIPTDKPGTLSMTLRQPVGAILSIVPWNGPVILAARAIAYPIACGNTVVFRASEMSPRTHFLVAQAFLEAGLPEGVLNFIVNAPEAGADIVDALISHPAIRRINFTGSTRVGRIIAERRAAISNAVCSNWAARLRSSCLTMPTSRAL
jgi:acyl-CoA reductase-like NAD-dependent aldehyde dehydrogenase